MSLLDRWLSFTGVVDEEQADRLRNGGNMTAVEIRPPRDGDVPATLERFVREIMEKRTRWRLWNDSPVAAFEIRRGASGKLRLQIAIPTERLERKVRNHLAEEVPGIGFASGVSGIPVTGGERVGGCALTVKRPDIFPLKTAFDRPPTNNIVAALHHHSMGDLRVVVQLLFQPVAGQPVTNWRWRRRAYRRIAHLRKEKYGVDPRMDRQATPAEQQQAKKVEEKARAPQCHVGIRVLLISVNEETVRSRVNEIGGAFNVFESPVANQGLLARIIKALSEDRVVPFAASVAHRRFDGWLVPFRASLEELAGLVAVPSIRQSNIQYTTA